MELKPGDIVFYKGQTLVSRLVGFFTKSKYTHVTIMVSNDMIVEANWNKKTSIVKFEYEPEIMEIYRLKDNLNSSEQIQIVQYVFGMTGKKYDYLQLLGYILERFIGKIDNNFFNSKDRIICSELIDIAYDNIGYDLVEKRKTGNVTPVDIFESKIIERIY